MHSISLIGRLTLVSMALAGLAGAQGVVVGGDKDKKASPKPAQTSKGSARPTSTDEADLLGDAAMRGDAASVSALLAKGIDPNARGSLGKTPLRMATSFACMMPAVAEKDLLATVDALIAGGANVNEVDDYGLGVLLMAAQKCKAAAVTRLLKAGADTEQRSPQGLSPLSMALIVKNYDAAGALVDHGARLSRESIAKLFPEPPTEPELAALVKRATATGK
jgi:ankyrin repeat protein